MSDIGLIRGLEVADEPGQIVVLEVSTGTPGPPGTLEWATATGGGVILTGGQDNPNPTPTLATQAALNGLAARVTTLERRPIIDAEFVQDTVGAMFPGATYNDTAGTITLPAGSDPEAVRDTVAGFMRAGVNVTVTHDDAGDTLTLGASGGVAASTTPRGTGGVPFQTVTRSLTSNAWTALTPSSPRQAFDEEVVGFVDANNEIKLPGGVADVTGSGVVAGGAYYVEFPASGSTLNMKIIPPLTADGKTAGGEQWPTPAQVNVDRRYYEVGRVYADGSKLYMRLWNKPVQVSTQPSPVKRVNVAGLAYDADLIANGTLVRMVQGAAQNGAAPKLKANGDAGVPATYALSPILKDVAGTQRNVLMLEVPFGADDYRYPAAWDTQLGGELLEEFQSDSNFDTARPRLMFCSSGGMAAGQLGTQYTLKIFGTSMAIVRSTSDGRTISGDTTLSASANVTFTANELWSFRLRVDEATKAVSVRAWKSGTAEPTAWQIDSFVIPELTAGRWGWAFRNGVNAITRAALAPNGVTATHA